MADDQQPGILLVLVLVLLLVLLLQPEYPVKIFHSNEWGSEKDRKKDDDDEYKLNKDRKQKIMNIVDKEEVNSEKDMGNRQGKQERKQSKASKQASSIPVGTSNNPESRWYFVEEK
ncbi:hypothetical protein M0804_009930 [Polistes exclamans]|nr:hypothetical protein M0804_009930 [Polistes exclamans]